VAYFNLQAQNIMEELRRTMKASLQIAVYLADNSQHEVRQLITTLQCSINVSCVEKCVSESVRLSGLLFNGYMG